MRRVSGAKGAFAEVRAPKLAGGALPVLLAFHGAGRTETTAAQLAGELAVDHRRKLAGKFRDPLLRLVLGCINVEICK